MDDQTEVDPEFTRIVIQLAKWEKEGARASMIIGPYAMYSLIGAIQLVSRHSEITSVMELVLRPLADQFIGALIEGYEGAPDGEILRDLIEKGWNPANDV